MQSRWPGRIALILIGGMFAAVMSMWGGSAPFGLSAFAQATATPTPTRTPTPTSTRACALPPPPAPCLPGGGGTSPSPTAASSPSPTPTDGGGGGETARSRITIRFLDRADAFKGRVSSSVSQCEPRRKVLLKRVVRGDAKDIVVGRDMTNREGRWRVELARVRAGRYYAHVLKSVVTNPELGEVTCRAARSDTVRAR